MPPIKAVLDTNVVISALLKGGGREALIFDLAKSGRFALVVSAALLREYEEVLGRPEFRFNPRAIVRVMRHLRNCALHADPRTHVQVTRDPDDNMVLECALAGGAQYVVTGNTRHFPSEFQGIRIIPPKEFLVILAAELE